MLLMRGSLALSHFRLERLLAKINGIVPQVNSISAEYLFFIDLEERLTKAENSILSSLLNYSDFYLSPDSPIAVSIPMSLPSTLIASVSEKTNQSLIIVLPKPGVISAWFRKATDIAHNCTLNKIRRIERGVAYSIEASERLTWGDEQAIAGLLYHPQIETVFYRLQDTEFLFKDLAKNNESKSVQLTDTLEDKKPMAIFMGFYVSHLRIPRFEQPWETPYGKPKSLASPLDIILETPIAEAKFNNELGCPNICGYFRTYEQVINRNGKRVALGYPQPIIHREEIGSIQQQNTSFQNNAIIFSQEFLTFSPIDLQHINVEEIIFRLLRFPCIAEKSFLITINDRTATGQVVRDQMVGPWQVPVSDCAVLTSCFDTYQGEAIAIGERAPLAILNPPASARMAVGEAITNIVGAQISALSQIRLSVKSAGAFEIPEEKAKLQDALEAIESGLCPSLGIAICANQELTSTETMWYEEGTEKRVIPPLSVVISAYAPVMDVRTLLTPLLSVEHAETLLIFIDLSNGMQRLGGSALAQVFNQVGDKAPDVDNPALLKSFFTVMQQLHLEGKILAYHDRSDGGLFITLCEMAFASHVGLQIDISELGKDSKSILFNEELGAVIQIHSEDVESVLAVFDCQSINGYVIGTLDEADRISIVFNEEMICSYARIVLQQTWSEMSFHLQTLRDNPRCAKKQFESASNCVDPGLNVDLTFDPNEDIVRHLSNMGVRPRVAILREQGTHGHIEMAAAFNRAYFECVDVHMCDLQNYTQSLADFKGLAVCGGFSFGDVLGVGLGWAKHILFNPLLREQFETFFNRSDTFTLGLSNGCQMLAGLKALIPGAKRMPSFAQNYSEQFESRLCLVEIQPSTAILLQGMEGSRLLVPVAHKEGRVVFEKEEMEEEIIEQRLVALRYVDNWGRKTKTYPANPNGSPLGITGLTTTDGRVLCMMPHPDRVFRTVQHSWHPGTWGEDGPWLRMFQNARKWVG
ncbi:MAG TPA: phosphoribosylformylglycinamidine synthase [Gammaproteobacteria bacterium]|nr:phosphoribosylformylglycinamidine synthase [Gammaproteobacteria bacterium]